MKIIGSGKKLTMHRAKRIITSSCHIIENGYVAIKDGVIVDVGRGKNYPGKNNFIDHGNGVLMPGLINAHTHLELSALKGMVPFDKGFGAWVKELLKIRQSLGAKALSDGVKQGIKELKASGSIAACEISTLRLTKEMFLSSGLLGIWFEEVLGGVENFALSYDSFSNENSKAQISLAAHAPHTTSPRLIKNLKKLTKQKGLVFSIHLDESSDEAEFITTGKGPWARFLKERKINFSDWGLPAKSPVEYVKRLGILDNRTLCVHLINSGFSELEILSEHKAKICVCPTSNYNLHKKLPDIDAMLKAGLNPALGTDSLASVSSLSIFDEMAFVAKYFPLISPEKIFDMATINGAKALGIEKLCGTIFRGKSGRIIYFDTDAKTDDEILEKIIHGEKQK